MKKYDGSLDLAFAGNPKVEERKERQEKQEKTRQEWKI